MTKVIIYSFLVLASAVCSFGQNKNRELYSLYISHLSKKDTIKAIQYLDSLSVLEKSNTTYFLISGALKFEIGHYASAIESFTKALEINPEIVDGYVRRGAAYLEIGEYKEANENFDFAIGKLPWQDSVAYRLRAFSNFNLSNYDKTLQDCDSALKFNSYDADVLYFKSGALLSLGHPEMAFEQIKNVLKIKPDSRPAHLLKCSILTVLQNVDEGLTCVQAYKKKFKDDSDINLVQGNIYIQLKKPEKALEQLAKVTEPQASSYQFYFVRGMAYFYLADNYQAINDFKKVLQVSPDLAEVYGLLADCYIELHENKIACDYLYTALQLGLTGAEKVIEENCK